MASQNSPTLHVGIIMDGNGRWAAARGLSRVAGHARGARRVTEIVDACPALGVTHLTLYAFSTENWRRPLAEVEALMRIFSQYITRKTEGLVAHGVRVRFIGMRHRISPRLRSLMETLEARTAAGRRLTLTIAIDYGGRDEITRGVRALAEAVADGRLCPEALCERRLAAALDTAALPDPDLILRTSGELRISNFLLWQATYAEYAFPARPWPDFSAADLAEALADLRQRGRRFGGVAPAVAVGG